MIDLVMWTLNGAETLEPVLNQINRVIPESEVNQRLIVDDGSKDETVKIAKICGWTVLKNEGKGISDGANTALKHVETERFASFEQDLFLAPNWWINAKKMSKNDTVFSGLRFSSYPTGVAKLQRFVAKKYLNQKQTFWLRGRESSAFLLGKTLDNTVYKTNVIREIGGFPFSQTGSGVDSLLAEKLRLHKKHWFVDYNVNSVHLRKSLNQELNHQFWYGLGHKKAGYSQTSKELLKFSISPFTGIILAGLLRCAEISVLYPKIRLSYLRGYLS